MEQIDSYSQIDKYGQMISDVKGDMDRYVRIEIDRKAYNYNYRHLNRQIASFEDRYEQRDLYSHGQV